jgi:hypothetical protein
MSGSAAPAQRPKIQDDSALPQGPVATRHHKLKVTLAELP